MRKVFGVLTLLVVLVGCNSFVTQSMNTMAAAQGVISQEQAAHLTACKASPTTTVCVNINKAVDAQNAAITGLEAYCQLPAPPTAAQLQSSGSMTCNANPSAKAALQTELTALSSIVAQIQGQ